MRSASSCAAASLQPGSTIKNSSPPQRINASPLAHCAAEQRGAALQHPVALIVAKAVIDGLEVVNVGQDQRVALALQLRRPLAALELLLASAAVEQAGQCIVVGLAGAALGCVPPVRSRLWSRLT